MLKDYSPILYCKNQVPSPNIYILIVFFTARNDWENRIFCYCYQFSYLKLSSQG